MFCAVLLQWYRRPVKRDTSSTLSEAELHQLALTSPYYPLEHYPPYHSADDDLPSSLVVNYSAAVSDASVAMPPVASKLESQAASATYTTPLGTTT